jgi:YidC/Oxa1 family membrane protein insertase
MELVRILLIGALVLIAWMLWDAWQHEHTYHVEPTPNVSSKKGGVLLLDPSPQIPETTRFTGSRFIQVKTDVLNVVIDTLGGNIVTVDLSQYKETSTEQPFRLLSLDNQSYYVAQSGLLSNRGPDTQSNQARYQSSQNTYFLSPKQNELLVDLVWHGKNLVVHKQFIFKRNDYLIELRYQLTNQDQQPWFGEIFTQIQRKKVEQPGSFFNMSSYYIGGSVSTKSHPFQKVTFENMALKHFPSGLQEQGWIAMLQHYFLTAWIPADQKSFQFYTHKSNDEIYTLGILGETTRVDPGQHAQLGQYKLYLGPEIIERLDVAAPNLRLTVDYGILWPISIALLWLLKQVYKIVHNWGWSIVIITMLIKGAFYHLSEKSYRSMAQMRVLQPRLQALRERHGQDRQKLTQATMDLYRLEKINPLGGCLPILVQIPVFLGLYWMLLESVELRQAPFILWIHDLSSKDPYYLLPILMGCTMLVQQRLNPPAQDPMQAKVMQFLPVFFTLLFLNFPSGLVLYWVVNNVLSILQQFYVTKKIQSQTKKK